jgi:hypothetical protein
MEALTELPQVQVQRWPGSLGMHEEYGADFAATLAAFL